MLSQKRLQGIALVSVVLLTLLAYRLLHGQQMPGSGASSDAAAEALKGCDTLAAHPHDPARYTAGVPDDQVAPGAAIETCKKAVDLNPGEARAWFELGRAFWIARRDTEAFGAFATAAKQGYAPAKKYIGDAFLEGRGLPAGENQSADAAASWYRDACGKICNSASQNVGFLDAEKALHEVEDYISKNRFDPSVFQNPKFISALYSGDFRGVDAKAFLAYVSGLVEEIGGDKILYVDSSCKPLSTIATGGLTRLGALLGLFVNKDSDAVSGFLSGLMGLVIYTDQGRRDAVTLVNRYGCKSDVAHRIMSNIVMTSGNSGNLGGQPRVTPHAPDADPGNTSSGQSAAFQAGRKDWDTWTAWINGLTGDAHDGADYWARVRNNPGRQTCSEGPGKTSQEAKDACEQAKAFLAGVDKNRNSSPDYKLGWNWAAKHP